MNTKRQTIWLVSMLSLMVVLSAYYLFTDDVDSMNTLSDSELNQIVSESLEGTDTELLGTNADGEVAVVDQEAAGSSDEKILEEYEASAENMSAEEFFATKLMERDEEMSKNYEQLMMTANESEETAAVQEAMAQISELQDKEDKIDYLEGWLSSTFQNAMITEENGKFRISVQASAMEKSEAVTIAETVMEHLAIDPNQLEIKLIQ